MHSIIYFPINFLVKVFYANTLDYKFSAYMQIYVSSPPIVYLNKKQNVHNRPCKNKRWESKQVSPRQACHKIEVQNIHTVDHNKSEVNISGAESSCIAQHQANTLGNLESHVSISGHETTSLSKQNLNIVENSDENVHVTSQERQVIAYSKQHLRARDDSNIDSLKQLFEKGNIPVIQTTGEDKKQETSKHDNRNPEERISLVDLFRYRHLKLKQVLLIYYNTSSHPDSVRGASWSTFASEIYRLCTFATYPQTSAKSASLLAAQGFVYIGNGRDDKVVCFYCGVKKSNWSSDDDIEDVHRRLSPACPKVASGAAQLLHSIPSGATNAPTEVAPTPAPLAYNGSISNQNHLLKANIENRSQDVPDFILQREHSDASGVSRISDVAEQLSSRQNNHDEELVIENALLGTSVDNFMLASTQRPEQRIQSRGSNSQTISSTGNETPVSSTETTSNADQIPSTSNADPIPSTNNVLISRNPTYSELGIMTERPKRQEYAHRAKRLETFTQWPRDHHLTPDELVEAGFYYGGYGDCARCFYCGGGLRNWDDSDDVWVEHARWFPRCFYVRQKMGQDFIDVVQNLHLQQDQITVTQIRERLDHQSSFVYRDNGDAVLREDPAVESVISLGFRESDVVEIARLLKQEGEPMSADCLIEKLDTEGKQKVKTLIIPYSSGNAELDREQCRQLKERNNMIRQQILCKICLDSDVSVVFLPCGHLVSCGDCSTAMRDCPVCRCHVRGLARAVLS